MSTLTPNIMTGTRKVFLPTGKLGVIFAGTPPVVKEIKSGSPVANKIQVGHVVSTLIIPNEIELSSMSVVELVSTLNAFANTPGRILVFKENIPINSTAAAVSKFAAAAAGNSPFSAAQNPAVIAEATPDLNQIALVLNQQSAMMRQLFSMVTDIKVASHETTINYLNQHIGWLQEKLNHVNRQLEEASRKRNNRVLGSSTGSLKGTPRAKLNRSESPAVAAPAVDTAAADDEASIIYDVETAANDDRGWHVSFMLKYLAQSGALSDNREEWKTAELPDLFAEQKLASLVLELCSIVVTPAEHAILKSAGETTTTPEELQDCVNQIQDKCMRQILIYEGHDPDNPRVKNRKFSTNYMALGMRLKVYKKWLFGRLRMNHAHDVALQDRPDPSPAKPGQAVAITKSKAQPKSPSQAQLAAVMTTTETAQPKAPSAAEVPAELTTPTTATIATVQPKSPPEAQIAAPPATTITTAQPKSPPEAQLVTTTTTPPPLSPPGPHDGDV